MATVTIHSNFRHDCSDWPEEFAEFQATKPHAFRAGDVVTVPDDAADYFCRAGWAAREGEEVVKPPQGVPVLVQPDNAKLGHSQP